MFEYKQMKVQARWQCGAGRSATLTRASLYCCCDTFAFAYKCAWTQSVAGAAVAVQGGARHLVQMIALSSHLSAKMLPGIGKASLTAAGALLTGDKMERVKMMTGHYQAAHPLKLLRHAESQRRLVTPLLSPAFPKIRTFTGILAPRI